MLESILPCPNSPHVRDRPLHRETINRPRPRRPDRESDSRSKTTGQPLHVTPSTRVETAVHASMDETRAIEDPQAGGSSVERARSTTLLRCSMNPENQQHYAQHTMQSGYKQLLYPNYLPRRSKVMEDILWVSLCLELP